MQLPKNWNSLTTSQFIELKALKEEDFGSLFLYNLEVLSIVTDTDPEELEDLEPEQLVDYIYQLNFLRHEPSKSAVKQIDNLHFKPFSLLTPGEFRDLEYYFANDFVKNLTNICGLCYRKKKVNEWNVEELAPYRFNPVDRAELFELESISTTYGVILEYLLFRDEIMKAYENLFMPDVEETDEELDPEDAKEEQEEIRFKKWGWEKVISTLRDGEQSPGATMTSAEKLEVARSLARMGVDIIEAGFPAASPDDLEAVRRIAEEVGKPSEAEPNAKVPLIAGLARANKADIDKAWEAIQGAAKPRIHTFLATSAIHMKHKLKMDPEDVVQRVSEMVAYAKSLCADVEFSPEDAGRSEPEFLYVVLGEAIKSGATTLNIPDTVGYTTPDEYYVPAPVCI